MADTNLLHQLPCKTQQNIRAKDGKGLQIQHVEDAQTSGVARHITLSSTIFLQAFASVTIPNVSSHPPFSLFTFSCERRVKKWVQAILKATLRANVPERTHYWGEDYQPELAQTHQQGRTGQEHWYPEKIQQDAVMEGSWTLIQQQELSLDLCCHMSHAGPKTGPRHLLSAVPFSTHTFLHKLIYEALGNFKWSSCMHNAQAFLSLRLPPKTGPNKVNNEQPEGEGWIFHMKVIQHPKYSNTSVFPCQAAVISAFKVFM